MLEGGRGAGALLVSFLYGLVNYVLPGKDPSKYNGLSTSYELISPLTHFMLLILFDTPWKRQTRGNK